MKAAGFEFHPAQQDERVAVLRRHPLLGF